MKLVQRQNARLGGLLQNAWMDPGDVFDDVLQRSLQSRCYLLRVCRMWTSFWVAVNTTRYRCNVHKWIFIRLKNICCSFVLRCGYETQLNRSNVGVAHFFPPLLSTVELTPRGEKRGKLGEKKADRDSV